MSESGSNQEASLPSNPFINNNSAIITSPDVIPPRRRMIQNYSILCMAQQIIPLINDIPQLDNVYVFSNIKSLHEELIKKCHKIKSVHTNIDDLCQELQLGIKQYHQDSIAISLITATEMALTDNLNRLDPTFMYTQLFKEILLKMKHNSQNIKDFITYCRQNNSGSPKNIDKFEKEYQAQSAIWWYTHPSFIYSMLNDGLRTLDADIIITMGFFLRDAHEQIQQLYEHQKTQSGLISFNNFLSTSKDKEVSIGYAVIASTVPDKVGILFIISIDPCIKSTPFASIEKESYFKKEEEEILFSMHTVFRVGTIKQMDNNNQLYQVELQLTSEDDQQLRLLTDRIREEAGGGSGWHRLGNLLLKIGQCNKAEELYNVLLVQTSDEDEKALCYHQLGCVKDEQGDHEKAIWYYKKSLETKQKTLPSNHRLSASSYGNIGTAYTNMGQYLKALSSHEKALEIEQKTLPSNHPDFATSYNNIGGVYKMMGEYPKALSFYKKSLEIIQKTLPSNHPSLAASYGNIGQVYDMMGEYSKALSFYEKSLEICQKTLPSNHPSLATLYDDIGSVYDMMGEYSKALSSLEKALEIRQKSLSTNYPSMATSYGNIGSVYNKMGEYSKALSFYEKSLEICQKTRPSNHPDLATAYSNNGSVYDMMGEYSKALSFYEKSLEICQKTRPSNHPDLATLYNNIGLVYTNMGNYPKALSSLEKALEIRQKTLPSNHPSLATLYDDIGSVYDMMGEYSKALSFYEKSLEIHQKTLPSDHPYFATSYNNIGSVYDKMEEYSKALSFHDKSLEICQKTLPSNHPDFATSYNNIGLVYIKMRENSKALSYFERALDIKQRALPSTHPSIKNLKESIKIIKEVIMNS
ncbi:unnamed protein product [Adineta steineri]|uniref:Uncharacterized protein n=1 Tax=Adineta steineri TaxID=433720 RepID=A0A815SK43_9BILA|nr:unnamed protein product [Adineta steineri]